MIVFVVLFGLALASALFAYVPIALIVKHTLNTEPPGPKDMLHRYVVDDSISTEEYVAWLDEQWRDKKHAPLA